MNTLIDPLYICLLPIVFMLHELEEIIMTQNWLHHNQTQLGKRFPRIKGMLHNLENLPTPAFTLAVAEEFIILSACTVIALTTGHVTAWYCCLLAFSLHLIIHFIQFLIVRQYIPAIITTILCLPYCIWAFLQISPQYTIWETIIWGITGSIFGVLNLALVHKITPKLWSKISM